MDPGLSDALKLLGVYAVTIIVMGFGIVAIWRFALGLLRDMRADQQAYLRSINEQTQLFKDFKDLINEVMRGQRGGGPQ